MAWLTPYVINGAKHPAELFRRQAQRPATDRPGVSRPGDLKVQSLPVPADGFRIAVGGASIPSRYGGRSRESYGVENSGAQIVVEGVTGTGSSGARRDLIVVEVLDPNHMQIDPVEAAELNYMRVRIIQNTTATSVEDLTAQEHQTLTGYAIAAINWPASTSTIGAGSAPTPGLASIEDLRRVARPQQDIAVRSFGMGGTADKLTTNSAYPTGTTWPNETMSESSFGLDIPDYATQMSIIMTVSGVQMNNTQAPGGDAAGWFWVQVGANVDPDALRTEPTRWDADAKAAQHRTTFRTADTVNVPPGMRGRRVRFYPRGNVTSETPAPGSAYSGPRAGNPFIPFPIADSGSSVDLMVVFREVKE